MMDRIPFVYQGGNITMVIANQTHTISQDSHINYAKILDALRDQDWQLVADLVDIKAAIVDYARGKIKIENGELYFEDELFHNVLAERILEMYQEGFPIDSMLVFMENLMENPSSRAVKELYTFLERGNLPITPDGCFLAYKRVAEDYTDIHSGKLDNSVGQVLEMRRNKVQEDKEITCSSGLHFCSLDYLPKYTGGATSHVMIVKINPRDVVSIPADYKHTKGRCCRYEVIGEHGIAPGTRNVPDAFQDSPVIDPTDPNADVLFTGSANVGE